MKIDIKKIFGVTTDGSSADKLDVKRVIEGSETDEETAGETAETAVAELEQQEEPEETPEIELPETPEELPEEKPSAEEVQEDAQTGEPEAGDEETPESAGDKAGAPEERDEADKPSDAPEASETTFEEDGEPEESEESEGVGEPEASEATSEEGGTVEEAEEAEEAEASEAAEESEASEEAPAESEEDAGAPSEAPEAPRKQIFPTKEKLLALGRSYGWMAGIAAAFAVLMAFMVIYTTMVPRDITVTLNGETFRFTTTEYTIGEFLESEGIEFCDEDYCSIPMTAFVQDGLSFEIKHATDIIVTADGKIKKYKTLDNTVQEALDDIGIKLGKTDIVTPELDTILKKDMRITVQRVVAKNEVVEETIPYKTVNQDDTSMDEGTSKVVTEGKDGKDKVMYEVVYTDGKETSRKEISRETVTAAVDEVVAIGTRVNYNGQVYSRKLVVKAYAYTGGGITAMGTRARVGEIAVDPSVIPLGTNVYIEGVGARRAEDTGGNIQGNTIDIYMNTQAECLSWGVRYVTIYIQ